MLVPMSGKRTDAFLVANRDAFAGCNFADATQLEFRKLSFPRIEQRNGIFARNGKKQFEIFAVCQRGEKRCFGRRLGLCGAARLAADRNGRRMKLRADTARFEDMAQVTS